MADHLTGSCPERLEGKLPEGVSGPVKGKGGAYDVGSKDRTMRWRGDNPERYREYMREYMRDYRRGRRRRGE